MWIAGVGDLGRPVSSARCLEYSASSRGPIRFVVKEILNSIEPIDCVYGVSRSEKDGALDFAGR